jgi:hypothetical protein
MSSNQLIRRARTALDLSEQDVAARAHLTIYELGDIKARADEICFSDSIGSGPLELNRNIKCLANRDHD